MERVATDPRDLESLQRGAKLFVNYCLNCHSAKYMRYNGLTELGLTEQQITENLILTGRFETSDDGSLQYVPTKIGDTMQVTMPAAQAKAWFGAPPPDLSVESARPRHAVAVQLPDRLLPRQPIGHRLEQPRVSERRHAARALGAVRHEPAGDAGVSDARSRPRARRSPRRRWPLMEPARDHKYLVKTLEVDQPGSMSPAEYRAAVGDLVNFMDYVGEPSKLSRERIGLVVLLFLGVLFVFAYG